MQVAMSTDPLATWIFHEAKHLSTGAWYHAFKPSQSVMNLIQPLRLMTADDKPCKGGAASLASGQPSTL